MRRVIVCAILLLVICSVAGVVFWRSFDKRADHRVPSPTGPVIARPTTATLTVFVQPGFAEPLIEAASVSYWERAQVHVNGQHVGTAPLEPLVLSAPGNYEVSVAVPYAGEYRGAKNDNCFSIQTERITLNPGDEKSMRIGSALASDSDNYADYTFGDLPLVIVAQTTTREEIRRALDKSQSRFEEFAAQIGQIRNDKWFQQLLAQYTDGAARIVLRGLDAKRFVDDESGSRRQIVTVRQDLELSADQLRWLGHWLAWRYDLDAYSNEGHTASGLFENVEAAAARAQALGDLALARQAIELKEWMQSIRAQASAEVQMIDSLVADLTGRVEAEGSGDQ